MLTLITLCASLFIKISEPMNHVLSVTAIIDVINMYAGYRLYRIITRS